MKNPGWLRQQAMKVLGFDQELAARLVNERPDDVERWVEAGAVPPGEDPRTH